MPRSDLFDLAAEAGFDLLSVGASAGSSSGKGVAAGQSAGRFRGEQVSRTVKPVPALESKADPARDNPKPLSPVAGSGRGGLAAMRRAQAEAAESQDPRSKFKVVQKSDGNLEFHEIAPGGFEVILDIPEPPPVFRRR